MARVKAGMRSSRGSTKRIESKIIVHRTAERGAAAFEACVRVGSAAKQAAHSTECAYGRNPRVAIANAMKQYARWLGQRQGAFRGVR